MSSSLRIALIMVSLSVAGCTQAGPRYDLIVRGGDVIDGSGQAARRADVGVAGDRITAIGDLSSASAGRVIDATGLVVAPGFIDVQGQSGTTLIADGRDAIAGDADVGPPRWLAAAVDDVTTADDQVVTGSGLRATSHAQGHQNQR